MSLSISQIVASTMRNYIPTLKSNLPATSPLFGYLFDKGNLKLEGGSDIVQPLEYDFNQNVQSFDGTDKLNIADNDIISAAVYDWKWYNVSITITETDLAKNKGKNGIIKLLESKIKNSERSLKNTLSTHSYLDGTGNAGKDMLGLKALVSTTPAVGTIGTIDASTNTFWRNLQYNGSAWGANGVGRNQIENAMVDIRANGGNPDLVVMGKTAFKAIKKEFAAEEMHVNVGGKGKKPAFGYASFTIENADVYFDRYCPDDYCYILSTDHMFLYRNTNMDFVSTPAQAPVDQALRVSHIRTGLQLGVSNRAVHAVINGITAA